MNTDKNTVPSALLLNMLAEIFYRPADQSLLNTLVRTHKFITDNKYSLNNDQLQQLIDLVNTTEDYSLKELNTDFNNLFTRPKGKLAYPWGSVYLNVHNRLFDETTLSFMDFCKKHQLNFNLKQNEPLDHFSLMLVALVHCLELDESSLANEEITEPCTAVLLQQHLLPWSDRFLELVINHSQTEFYKKSAKLAANLLAQLTQQHQIELEPARLYK
ncbi:hypothetical protein FLM48_10075 [Shewanella sp. Scap07]|uniref:TorD/DmsD family molecular chaperone n=1 Tax=Shewanella sp. Scap07 TaxID=2589987 RepID=UPI0015BA96AE|nr:molecular chaperone TorD family protein [Shewanella sp. Scap07]QLE85396.1 hypothetical protein FLM48_10075 [Shewanella sp. Scap07]